ncbi:uncharacterized protein EAE97_005166 [Botrytis byssoidea]|uniref:DJ-1/PfpI domain-containing protein n=1 Tax=Botrytis byssoidea TaxID=139641 RepID=A0A9P5IM82_9HELO|nr:uncharacterized protein EAE97_005166 [Botrytis byssoidea]KAF7944533.1 hypothetical protein EAE97_005166 [Botrytis byssoidea]
MSSPKHLRIGVFNPAGCQLLDMSGIDIFFMLSPEYLSECGLPPPLIGLGISCTIYYISLPSTGPEVRLTANAMLRISKTTIDNEVQPGMLDIVMVPGPDPRTVLDQDTRTFLKSHAEWRGENGEKVDILSICTGIFLVAQSGILKGLSASGPRALIPRLKKEFPDTKWMMIGGGLWIIIFGVVIGGITNGLEMIAAYIRQKFPGPAAEAVMAMADVGEKGVFYTNEKRRKRFGGYGRY